MPKSTMHLWVAKKIAERLKFEAGASFLLGNIAPDAISVRPDRTKADKQTAHLRQSNFSDGYKNAKKILNDFSGNEFLKGCALHIMLDDLWTKGPYYKTLKYLEQDHSTKEAKILYLKDIEYVESWLFRQNTSRALWSGVMNAPTERFFDILTPGEIEDFRKKTYIKLNNQRTGTPSKYITLDVVYSFMDDAVIELSRELRS